MARSFSTATLTVKLQENIVLGGQNMGSLNSFSVSGIKNVVKRLMTATTAGASILTFHNSEEAAGQYIEANVRYIRITNLDDTNFIVIQFTDESSHHCELKLEAGKTLMFGDVSSVDDQADIDNFSASTITKVIAKADTADVDIEVYIASL